MKKIYLKVFKYVCAFCRWLILGVLTGALCGVVGAAFAGSVSKVTALREENNWLIFVLPIAGLLSVAVYKLCRVAGIGTNRVLESVQTEKQVPLALAPAIFAGAVLTHLGGGSAGREGAALQLGGSISALLSKILRLDENTRRVLTICGMGAFFSAIFGTPIGACVFALEVVCVGHICSAAIFPGLVSSVTAYSIAGALGVAPERFSLSVIPSFSLSVLWRVTVIALAGAVVSMLFCRILHFADKKAEKLLKNEWLRIFAGGAVIVLLTVAVGTTDYNGGGIEVIERIFSQGEVRPEAFLLKILFTVITVAAGFKGGEIIPSFFIGAALGAVLATLMGLDPAFGAAIGMVALFCGVTNCFLATIFLSVELFGGQGVLFFAITSAIAFVVSGDRSLYTAQKSALPKLKIACDN